MTPAQTKLFASSTCVEIHPNDLLAEFEVARSDEAAAEGEIEGLEEVLEEIEAWKEDVASLPADISDRLEAYIGKIEKRLEKARERYENADEHRAALDYLIAGVSAFPVIRMTMAPRDLFALYEEQALRKSIVFHRDIMLSILSASIAQKTGHIIVPSNMTENCDWQAVMNPYYDTVLDYDIMTEIEIYAQVRDMATAQLIIANW